MFLNDCFKERPTGSIFFIQLNLFILMKELMYAFCKVLHVDDCISVIVVKTTGSC